MSGFTFSDLLTLEVVPMKIKNKYLEHSFEIESSNGGKSTARLIPFNLNMLNVMHNISSYQEGCINGAMVSCIIESWQEERNTEVEFTYYRFPKYLTKENEIDDQQEINLFEAEDANSATYGLRDYTNMVMNRYEYLSEQSIDVSEMTVTLKNYLLRIFNIFCRAELDELQDVYPFKANSPYLKMFKTFLARGNRAITNYEYAYLNESKVMFILNVLNISLNKFIASREKSNSKDDIIHLLEKISISQNNLWQFAKIIKLDFINDVDALKLMWGILCGKVESKVDSITEIPASFWLGDGMSFSYDKTGEYAIITMKDGKQILAVLKSYEDITDYLMSKNKYVLRDVVQFNQDQAIFKLIEKDHPIMHNVVTSFETIKGKYVEKLAFTKEVDLLNMSRSKIRDMLLILAKIAIFGIDVVKQEEGEKIEITYLTSQFKVLFYRNFIAENITNMYKRLFNTMSSIEFIPTDTYDENELVIHNDVHSVLNAIRSFVKPKLEELNIQEDDKYIDKYLSQIISAYRNDILKAINVE